ncbi:exported protein family 1, putative [Plasmodium reichenowi]|uniref:Exported protein family 1, putative n=1 Tax=Plasmodium reichenowi TaxID=5854 RepID=A0A2P9DSF4_PLARE|nr:exported protein family 1, putative [Plasmodium reichenowi]
MIVLMRNKYSFNNNNNKIRSSSEEDILDEKKLDDNTRNIMKKSYEILDVNEDSEINEIKRKFYNLSLKYYPNMN